MGCDGYLFNSKLTANIIACGNPLSFQDTSIYNNRTLDYNVMRDAMLQMIPTTITITGKTISWSCSSNVAHQTRDDFAALLYTTNAGGCGALSSSPSPGFKQILWHLALQNVDLVQKEPSPNMNCEHLVRISIATLRSHYPQFFCKLFYLFIANLLSLCLAHLWFIW